MLVKLALLAVASVNPATAPTGDRVQSPEGPSVEVWTDQDDVYHRGDRVRVHFRASDDGYITVFRIDTDGRLRVLYPTEPWQDNYARGEKEYEVRSYGDRYAFSVDDYPGEGYVFAVVSRDPFSYGPLVRGDHWDYRVIAEGGRVTGDPYVALTDLVDRIIPANYSEYSYDVQPYHVEQHYQYPRFLCYDCHSYASYPYWNPYSYSCFRFRIVIYDDYFYYPRRSYRGERVVYRTAPRLAPRYVFKDRGPSESYVTTVRQRPVDAQGRRVVDRGVTSRDLGAGGGRVQVPVTNGRAGRRPVSSETENGPGYNGGRRTIEREQPNVNRRPDMDPRPGEIGQRRPVDRNPSEQPAGRAEDNTSRRQDQSSSNGENRDNSRTNPSERPARIRDDGSNQNESSGRPSRTAEQDRPQPRLERRDPRREPERGDPKSEPRSEPARDGGRQPDRPQADRQPDRPRPERQPDRPRVERQPEPRAQPKEQPRQQEPRRAEPRSEPRSKPQRAPAEKPKDSEHSSRSGRRMN